MSHTKILSLAVLSLMLAAPAFAQDTTSTEPTGPDGVRKELHQDIKAERKDMAADHKAGDKAGVKENLKEIRKDKSGLRKDRRGDRHERRN